MKVTIQWEESDIKKGIHVTTDDYNTEYMLMCDNNAQPVGVDLTMWYLVNVAHHHVIELGNRSNAILELSKRGYRLRDRC